MTLSIQKWLRQGRLTMERFDDDAHWRDASGHVWNITDMETSHIVNAIARCERHAANIATQYGWGMVTEVGPTADVASQMYEIDLEREWDQQNEDPLAWIRSTTLMQAMRAELERREPRRCKCGRLWRVCHDGE